MIHLRRIYLKNTKLFGQILYLNVVYGKGKILPQEFHQENSKHFFVNFSDSCFKWLLLVRFSFYSLLKRFSEAQQTEYEKWYKAKYPSTKPKLVESDLEFKAPKGYSANLDHHIHFYKGSSENAPIRENALFGMLSGRTCVSYQQKLFRKENYQLGS